MTDSSDPEIMTIDQAAQLLGVSVKTFNKVLHTQSIPARKIGREWKFSRRALIDWIGSGRSEEFYREPIESVDSGAGSGRRDSREDPENGSERRTSGWRLELD